MHPFSTHACIVRPFSTRVGSGAGWNPRVRAVSAQVGRAAILHLRVHVQRRAVQVEVDLPRGAVAPVKLVYRRGDAKSGRSAQRQSTGV